MKQVNKIVQQVEAGRIGILGAWGHRSKIHGSGQQSGVESDVGMDFTCVHLL